MGTVAQATINWITNNSAISLSKRFAMFSDFAGGARVNGVGFIQVLASPIYRLVGIMGRGRLM